VEKIWLKSYQEGVPAEVDLSEFQSLGELFEKSVAKYRDRVAYINMGVEITYAELDKLSRDFAAYLQSVLKLPQGARVALMMPNVLQYPICIFGALRAGYVVVNVNPLYTPRELEHQLKDSGADVIVILENFAVTLEQVVARTPVKHIVVARLGDMLGFPKGAVVNFVVKYVKKMVPAWSLPRAVNFRSALAKGAFGRAEGGRRQAGRSGVSAVHGWNDRPLERGHADSSQHSGQSRPGARLDQAGARDRAALVVTALPLYHIFALTANCFTFFKIGASNLLITNPRDIPGFVAELGKHPFTVITGVNTLFNAMLNNDAFCALDFSKLKVTLGGGMAVQRAVAESGSR
jgi:long-chain acyl-CoA synthetase